MNTQHQPTVVHPAVIIGAGHFGLSIAHALQERGLSVPVFDAADRGAAAWRRRHPQQRLNTHRLLSSLPGLRMPRRAGAFPSRDDVVRYLEAWEWRKERPVESGDTSVPQWVVTGSVVSATSSGRSGRTRLRSPVSISQAEPIADSTSQMPYSTDGVQSGMVSTATDTGGSRALAVTGRVRPRSGFHAA